MPAFKEVKAGEADFNMFESHAIMKYICATRNLPDHWYPKDAKSRAKMDMYLDWHHAGVRMGAGGYMYRKYISGLMDKNGVWATQFAIDESWSILLRSLTQISRIWLRADRGTKFMFGDLPSIADLSLACEVANLEAIKFPLAEKFPTISEWMNNMLAIPGFKEIHDKGVSKVCKMIGMLDNQAKM